MARTKKTQKMEYPKSAIHAHETDREALKKATVLLKSLYETKIDNMIVELEEQEKNAVGSKLTATLKGQNLLRKLKTEILSA